MKSHLPAAASSALARPLSSRVGLANQKRTLSEKQLALPFFRRTLERLKSAKLNRSDILPNLNRTLSGRQTRSEIYDVIEKLGEPLLARLDLATGVLGWVDDRGQFWLNSQKGLCEDTGISTSRMSRVLHLLSERGYVTKKTQRVALRAQASPNTVAQDGGLFLVRTRTYIKLHPLFFRHLGVGLHFRLARAWARKRRNKLVAALQSQKMAKLNASIQENKARELRRRSFQNAVSKAKSMAEQEANRSLYSLIAKLSTEYPHLTSRQLYELARQQQGGG